MKDSVWGRRGDKFNFGERDWSLPVKQGLWDEGVTYESREGLHAREIQLQVITVVILL